MVKIGDKVLCIKYRQHVERGKYYFVGDIIDDGETIDIDGLKFHLGEYTNKYHNFCDYFDTKLSIRKKKLNKLNSL